MYRTHNCNELRIGNIGEGIRAMVLLVIIFLLFLPEYIRENPKE